MKKITDTIKNFFEINTGEMGRRRYFRINIISYAILAGLEIFAIFLLLPISEILAMIVFIMSFGWLFVCFYIFVASSMRRIVNIGRSPWYLLLLLVPFVQIFFFLYLFLQKGKQFVVPIKNN